MIIDCISDLHGHYPELEGGDLLIVAGDLTASDKYNQYVDFFRWMRKQKYKKKVFISGNHDNLMMSQFDWGDPEPDYLCDSGTEFDGLKIWGSPWTSQFPGMNPKCMAFTCDTEEELAEKWSMIPDDIDILITHGPSWGMHDKVYRCKTNEEENVGSKSLLSWTSRHISTLKLHVYGHIHEGYGVYDVRKVQDKLGSSRTSVFVNASHVNEYYKPVNKPVRIEL